MNPQMIALYELAQEVGNADFVAALELAAEQQMYGAEYVRAIVSMPTASALSSSAETNVLVLLPSLPAQHEVERDLAQYERYVANRDQVLDAALRLDRRPGMSESLDHKLTTLKLARVREVYPSWILQAAQSEMGYGEFLEQLVTEELLARQENQLRRKMQAAGFPYAATIDQFDFTLRPELKRTVMLRFFDSSFVTTAGSLVLIGPSGLGKHTSRLRWGRKWCNWATACGL